MLGSAVIVFRESLEAALIVGILAAATRGVANRGRWLLLGGLFGLVGSLVVAQLADQIAEMAEGTGQELFNAIVLGLAVLMLASHNIWMTRHGAELAKGAKKLGNEIASGTKELSALALIVCLAVLREGSETVLFLHGMLLGGEQTAAQVVTGGALGLGAGVLTGLVLFLGILRMPVKWFFTVTSGLILLLAAAMAGQMAKFLVQGDYLPGLVSPLWNFSAVLPNDSAPGMVLHTLLGYEASPSAMQVIFYASCAGLVALGMFLVKRKQTPQFERIAA